MFRRLGRSVDLEERVRTTWERDRIFERANEAAEGKPAWVFYEGPPTANGTPHNGHVLTRAETGRWRVQRRVRRHVWRRAPQREHSRRRILFIAHSDPFGWEIVAQPGIGTRRDRIDPHLDRNTVNDDEIVERHVARIGGSEMIAEGLAKRRRTLPARLHADRQRRVGRGREHRESQCKKDQELDQSGASRRWPVKLSSARENWQTVAEESMDSAHGKKDGQ